MNRPPVPLAALAATLFFSLVGILAGSGLAAAHGNPEITVTPSPAVAGGNITIDGMGFDENEDVSLVLEGVSGEIALGMVTTDAEGNLHAEGTLPHSAGPGSYRVRASSSDATAIADLEITTGVGAPAATPAHETSIGFHRAGSTTEVIALSAILAVFAVFGLGLVLWRERPAL